MKGRTSFRPLVTPLASLALGAVAVVGAQPVAASPPQHGALVGRIEIREGAPGWVGIEFRKVVVEDTTRVMISSVFPDGPADRAGLRAGDRILRVNGARVSFAMMESIGPRIQPGDPWTFTVLRNAEVVEIPLTAEVRPESGDIIVARMQAQLDTLRKLMHLTLDSLERTGQVGLPSLEVRHVDQRDGSVTVVVSRAGVVSGAGAGGRDTFTVSGARLRPDGAEWADADHFVGAWIRRDSTRVDRAVPFAPARAVTDAGAPARVEVRVRPSRDAPPAWPGAEGWTMASPLSPYAEGARRVAGAELHPVGADLGRYLGVSRGLLVANVTEGTPAAKAGLVAGDVLLSVNTVSIESLEELRELLAIPAPSHTLFVIRAGRELDLVLGR